MVESNETSRSACMNCTQTAEMWRGREGQASDGRWKEEKKAASTFSFRWRSFIDWMWNISCPLQLITRAATAQEHTLDICWCRDVLSGFAEPHPPPATFPITHPTAHLGRMSIRLSIPCLSSTCRNLTLVIRFPSQAVCSCEKEPPVNRRFPRGYLPQFTGQLHARARTHTHTHLQHFPAAHTHTGKTRLKFGWFADTWISEHAKWLSCQPTRAPIRMGYLQHLMKW